jgi:hypothetical protein
VFDDPLDIKGIDFRKKPAAAAILYEQYIKARQHNEYFRQKKRHQEKHDGN